MDRALRELAAFVGVQTSYHDWQGTERVASTDGLLAILRDLGVDIEHPDQALEAHGGHERGRWETLTEPVVVAWDGEPTNIALRVPADESGAYRVRLELESGHERVVDGRLDQLPVTGGAESGGRHFVRREIGLDAVELGYHRVVVDAGARRSELFFVAAPRVAHAPPGSAEHRWGVFAPLYALRSREGSGAGCMAELHALARHVDELGGSFVGTLPLLASFLDEPFEPSPYSPVSRLFWNELYLDPTRAPGLEVCPAARRRLASDAFVAEARALRRAELVDYRRQMALQRSVFEELADAAWGSEPLRAELERFVEERPRTDDYARFRAVVERTRRFWPEWEPRLRDGDLREGDFDPAAWRYHVYVQFAMHRELAPLDRGGAAGLYLDLPVGVNRFGYDVWRDRDAFALGMSAGAPPDELFTGGQNWGLPPLHPWRARRDGYRYFRDCLAAHCEHADMLRIDHVMGLHRLFWVPEGAHATEGIYVGYQAEELYAILCMESNRHRCAVVGEDLGTVPDEVRPAMDQHGIHRLFVGQFSMPGEVGQDPDAPPREAVASLNTHDVPTFAGYWNGQEIDQRVELGLLAAEQADAERAGRAQTRSALRDFARRRLELDHEPELDEVLRACHRFLAASEADMMLVNIEDLWLEPEPQNVPGTGPERPNWRRTMARSLESITSDDGIAGELRAVDALRRRR